MGRKKGQAGVLDSADGEALFAPMINSTSVISAEKQ